MQENIDKNVEKWYKLYVASVPLNERCYEGKNWIMQLKRMK